MEKASTGKGGSEGGKKTGREGDYLYISILQDIFSSVSVPSPVLLQVCPALTGGISCLPDGTPFTWWIGRSNERHPYWGGSPPGVQQCECGLDESCLDIQHFCNCDADKDEW